ncbi:peptide-methionine (S)-S-oxide reductase [Pseudoxanthomonas sp. GM95]|uniref:peptide-methionine (S)-S-oxide reductase MsrA n=1 Tax=Pseudoxanthomonas sp. GM95 TaxID=1881043 RepID=UPI0008D02CA3|nr:peptide-methionine (S)-S-oxide reductase MsrA [Pseudoxanthomonas sp. GM95]SEM22267.1 peptide-methionine (S)-S-oxide reductase [Pseudoxanthomonas sp. GM95]
MHIAFDKLIAGACSAGIAGLLLVGFFTAQNHVAMAAETATDVPAPLQATAPTASTPDGTQTAIFAGGCFWGVQGVFQHVKGVQSAVSGYTGGAANTAHYEVVSSGRTGHAESVRVTYDPSQVSYAQLLQLFFSVVHDPTQLDRQGPDRGTQYRSAIFTTTPDQQRDAAAYVAQLQGAHTFPAPIVTTVQPAKPFYAAERHHQDYLTLNPGAAYIRYYDAPKLADLKQRYPALYRETPVLVAKR